MPARPCIIDACWFAEPLYPCRTTAGAPNQTLLCSVEQDFIFKLPDADAHTAAKLASANDGWLPFRRWKSWRAPGGSLSFRETFHVNVSKATARRLLSFYFRLIRSHANGSTQPKPLAKATNNTLASQKCFIFIQQCNYNAFCAAFMDDSDRAINPSAN